MTARRAGAVTAFRQRVYDALREVPAGCVTTYGELAARVGCRCARAIGGALRANPYAPEVPCHRVIAADGTLGGFNGQSAGPALERKAALLRAEGVPLDNTGRLLARNAAWCGPAGTPAPCRRARGGVRKM